jgi:hypothetical protein
MSHFDPANFRWRWLALLLCLISAAIVVWVVLLTHAGAATPLHVARLLPHHHGQPLWDPCGQVEHLFGTPSTCA